MKQIPMLKKGDTVALMCPASPKRPTQNLEKIEQAIINLGFKVKTYPSAKVGETYEVNYLALSDEARAQEIMNAFKDDNIKGIICLKGGYGSSRLLDLLDFETIKKHPKFFTGYSDITALINAFYFKSGFVSFQGFLGISLISKSLDKMTMENINHILFHPQLNTEYNYGTYISKVETTVQGELIGGNLSLFTHLLGSPYFPSVKNKIIFLEDVDEEPYSIDRMITKLRLFNCLKDAKGIVLGYFTTDNEQDKKEIEQLLLREFGKLEIPVLNHFPSGHEMPFISLPIGSLVELSPKGLKIIEEIYK